jgi:hypothetical protein
LPAYKSALVVRIMGYFEDSGLTKRVPHLSFAPRPFRMLTCTASTAHRPGVLPGVRCKCREDELRGRREVCGFERQFSTPEHFLLSGICPPLSPRPPLTQAWPAYDGRIQIGLMPDAMITKETKWN